MKKTGSRIGVFDSGVGGLTVLSALQKKLPEFEYIYCYDNAYYPYGTKSDEELVNRLTKILPLLVKNYHIQILVLACNTASTIALEAIRKVVSIPVVGVVPAIKPAALHSQTRVLGLLATEATIRGKYTENLIHDFAKDCELVKVASRNLVDYAEAKMRGEIISLEKISVELAPFFKNTKVDTIILACTHFDHLREEFEKLSPRPIHWISSAGAVASRVQTLVKELHLKGLKDPQNCLVATKDSDFKPEGYGFRKFETLK